MGAKQTETIGDVVVVRGQACEVSNFSNEEPEPA